MSDTLPTAKPKTYLRAAQVRARYGDCSDMWITRKTREAGFPLPIFLGSRDRFWRAEDLDAWDTQTIAKGALKTPLPPTGRKAVRS